MPRLRTSIVPLHSAAFLLRKSLVLVILVVPLSDLLHCRYPAKGQEKNEIDIDPRDSMSVFGEGRSENSR